MPNRMAIEVIRPFRITVAKEVLDDLRERLDRIPFPSAVANPGWDYATELDYMRDLIAY